MKKVLITANSASMIKLFNQINIAILQSMGYEIHVACNFYSSNTISPEAVALSMDEWKTQGIVVHQVGYLRSPFTWKSFQIYKQINALIQTENFDLIHCHTPVVAAFTRLAAAKARRQGKTKLIYTAHGFHFYRGAPLNYPIEKLCSYFADDIITINQEDYHFAKRHFASARIHYLPGIGIDTAAYHPCALAEEDRSSMRSAFGIQPGQKMILSVGELIARKNYKTAIDAIAKQKGDPLRYYICGQGALRAEIEEYAKAQGVSDRVVFLGYRSDVPQICACADVFLHTSYQEGLPVAVMEAMACGTPIVASRIRGNVDLIEDGVNGFLCDPEDGEDFADKIQTLLKESELAQKFRTHSLEKIKDYDKSIVAQQLRKIYCETKDL